MHQPALNVLLTGPLRLRLARVTVRLNERILGHRFLVIHLPENEEKSLKVSVKTVKYYIGDFGDNSVRFCSLKICR